MITAAYSKTIDALRDTYNKFHWLKQWFFPRRIVAAMEGLAPIAQEPGKSTPYELAQAITLITAFNESNWLFKLVFQCLRVFKASSLLRDYDRNQGNPSFLDPVNRIGTVPKPLVQSNLSAFLNEEEKEAFASCSSYYFALFEPARKKAKVNKLLQHVARGQQQEAQALLQNAPELLIEQGSVTDYSGRTFFDVSPWKLMLWTGDTWDMSNMMLDCVLESNADNEILQELYIQCDAMQAGGRDLVRMYNNPIEMPVEELKLFLTNLRADNQDILIYHWDWDGKEEHFYYYTNNTLVPFKYTPTNDNERFLALFKLMELNTAKKSNDAEHELITAATQKTLSRHGIRYEQPAIYKYLIPVKFGDDVSPCDVPFEDINMPFHAQDALLFSNNQFYYANKADSSVMLLTPTDALSAEQNSGFEELKAFLNTTRIKYRLPRMLQEYRLINTLFAKYPAFKPTQHCDSQYDFGVIDELRTAINDLPDLDWWMNRMARAQRNMPIHVLQHSCDADPTSDFKTVEFKRRKHFYHGTMHFIPTFSKPDQWSSLLSEEVWSLLGFHFGFTWSRHDALLAGQRCLMSSRWTLDAAIELKALSHLYTVRTADTIQLQDRLRQLLEPVAMDRYETKLVQ